NSDLELPEGGPALPGETLPLIEQLLHPGNHFPLLIRSELQGFLHRGEHEHLDRIPDVLISAGSRRPAAILLLSDQRCGQSRRQQEDRRYDPQIPPSAARLLRPHRTLLSPISDRATEG